jgi:uncharacterized protein YndB with AHSA1/START domain
MAARPDRRVLPVAVIAALALVVGLAWAPATGTPPPELSADEAKRLAAGEVVYRDGAPPRDGVPVSGARGAVSFVRVPTGPDPVWAILTEPRRYPEVFPGLRVVEVLEESADGWVVRNEGKFGPFAFRYHMRYRLQPADRILAWRLDKTRDNDAWEDNWGFWQLVPEDGATLVVYAMGSIPTGWQPLAGYFERRGTISALAGLRDAAVRRAVKS